MQKRNKPAPQQRSVIFEEARFYKGPLPEPEVLNHYNSIEPGFANRIIKLTEDEALHRRSMDIRIAWMNFTHSVFGMICALSAIAGVIWLCWFAFSIGAYTQAASIAVGVLVGIGGVFVWRNKNHKESK